MASAAYWHGVLVYLPVLRKDKFYRATICRSRSCFISMVKTPWAGARGHQEGTAKTVRGNGASRHFFDYCSPVAEKSRSSAIRLAAVPYHTAIERRDGSQQTSGRSAWLLVPIEEYDGNASHNARCYTRRDMLVLRCCRARACGGFVTTKFALH